MALTATNATPADVTATEPPLGGEPGAVPPTGGESGPAAEVDARIERLSVASLRRVIEPDEAVPGGIGDGPVLPAELLSIAGLDIDLDPEQLRTLAREEVASITDAGIRFESILTAGFSMQIAQYGDLTDPRVTYMLHELGEETRHSRLFVRLLSQLQPRARNPLAHPVLRFLERRFMPWLTRMPAFLCVLVLSGEEIPDLFQKLAAEHPDTDPFIRQVNRYHRQEEARHLAFARMILPEAWRDASWMERRLVERLAPSVVGGMFETIVHPGVYATVGLPAWPTWRAVNRSARRLAVKHQALRPVLAALIAAGAIRPGRVPRGWRQLCHVDRRGEPLD
ncbi:MAG TPA: diiron oxygenase [Acidimicrobiales bacterium]|nr:diiron oxygenase [Acidimicrobiales bacterium]